MKRVQLLFFKMQFAGCFLPARFIFLSFLKKFQKIFLPLALFLCVNATAQNKNIADTAYQNVIAQRSAKIVNTLDINKKRITKKVQQVLMQQYFVVNNIHDAYKAGASAIKASDISAAAKAAAVKVAADKKNTALMQQHAKFIAQLSKKLSAAQIEKIKDGMTYSVLPKTWAAYLDMLQQLTAEQKDTMYAWLTAARELAMDEGSSDAKHAVFGKYKGKINNYLSAQGYDMNKEGADWAKRIQAAKENKQNQN